MLILGAGELQIRPNGEWSAPSGQNQRSLFAKRGKVNLANRSKSYKSFLPRKGRKQWLVFFIPNKRIGNAYTRCGRIANSPERQVAGLFLIRNSALEMLMLGAVELQIRPNGAYKIKGVSDIHSQPGGNAKCYLKHAFECNRAEPAP